MRFNKMADYGPYNDTRRKRLALARKQRLEREALPLFAEIIAEQQPDADTVMADRAREWERWSQQRRDDQARRWREARAALFKHGDNTRRVLRELWKRAPYPGTPVYFHGMLHSFEVGRLDPDNPPWVYRGPGLRQVDSAKIVAEARKRQGLEPLP